VVTSPIGDQVPPALAATTIIPTNISLYLIHFLISVTTIVVVRLSKIAERKKRQDTKLSKEVLSESLW
jgi:hypothetical protein